MIVYRIIAFHLAAFLLIVMAATPGDADELTRDELKFFETKIRPVLIRECYGCHSNKSGNVRGGLRLDTKQLMHIGGSSGPAVVPGKPKESWLYNAITHQDFVMPPKRRLPKSVIEDFRKWIEMGAPDPRVNKIASIKSSISKEDIAQAKRSFWAFQPPVKKSPHAVADKAWPRTDVDRYVLAKLEQADLKPAGDAEPWKVLRRLSFDLVGLPPSPEQIDSFTASWKRSPDRAISDAVDSMLATRQYGERWGRHWLDVVRYGESTGLEVNMTFPHAWRYRDYVIDSFNTDKPFDRFVQEQIAGDLLPVDTDEQWAKNLIATTFLAIGPKNVNEQNAVQFAANLIDEQIDATTRVFLGMSVACARCHDHKFDAFPQTDYYAMVGMFGSMKTYFGNPQSEYGSFSGPQAKQNSTLLILPVDDPNPFDKSYTAEELSALRTRITDSLREMSSLRRNRNGKQNTQRERIRLLNQLQSLSGQLGGVDSDGKPRSYTMGVQEKRAPSDAKLLVRGEIDQPAQTVPRGLPHVLARSEIKLDRSTSGRRELAEWIGSRNNTLTARVMVNRIWQHMIGQGIVTSTENFGTTGQMPTHPALLDYLAVRFVESGWSVKSVIREIANSRVYRIRSAFNKKHHDYDPNNSFLWRASPRRLDAEAIRDAMLSISGEIELARPRASEVAKAGYTRVQRGQLGNARGMAGGRRPFPFQPGGPRILRGPRFRTQRGPVSRPLDMEDAKFRSVYLPVVRDEEPRSLGVFDFADSSAITGKREASNTANQALYMMNNQFVIRQGDAFAQRIIQPKLSQSEQIALAFRIAYGRSPSSGEKAATTTFFQNFASSTHPDSPSSSPMAVFCQSLFASAEFRFID